MKPEPVYVVGMGVNGYQSLRDEIKTIIREADHLIGSQRLLAKLPFDLPYVTVLKKDITGVLQTLIERPPNQRVVILASGDPGFFGIAANVLAYLPPDQVRIIPNVSCLQEAFARISETWSDAVFTSAHARPITEVIGLARRYRKVGILTDPVQTPAWIAERLLAAGVPDCRAVVIENLGEPNEHVHDTALSSLIRMSFEPLNVLLLLQEADWQPAPLIALRADDSYNHRNGLITKADIRLLSIGHLGLRETDVVWDIGAGSGAVSIEIAEICWRGKVFAVEKDEECLHYLRMNISRFAAANVEVIEGSAPQALQGLPPPNAVFIGGSSGNMEAILSSIEQAAQQNCRVVANFAVLENLLYAYHWMENHAWQPSLLSVQISYGSPIAGGIRLAPINPVFILYGTARTEVSQ